MSLDDLMSKLENNLFLRANRQLINSIIAIDKIIRFGNSQLKILISSKDDLDIIIIIIIISKNRTIDFKQWLK
jgi:hypothetical protein